MGSALEASLPVEARAVGSGYMPVTDVQQPNPKRAWLLFDQLTGDDDAQKEMG